MTHAHPSARAAALLAGLLLGACAGPAAEPAPTAPPGAGSSAATADAAPAGSASASLSVPPKMPEMPDMPVALPWPSAGAADVRELQAAVDAGAQPWLLDPSEVALAYAAAAHGWTEAQSYPGPGGTTVDVRNPAGDQITLTLDQPVRPGDAGIWVVTSEEST